MQYGSKNISELQYGSKNIIAAYWGSKKVWELGNVEDYCTIEALEDGLTISFSNTIEYSTDCKIWRTLEANTISKKIKSGQKLYFKANLTPTSANGIGTFSVNKNFKLYGNVMSLLFSNDGKNNDDITEYNYAFKRLFQGCTTLQEVSNDFFKKIRVLSEGCYEEMFSGCTSLVNAPELPITTLTRYCYLGMFDGCSSLKLSPELHATELVESCYERMFKGCTSLGSVPSLPATILVENCYKNMFYNCSNLNFIEALFVTPPSEIYTKDWVYGVYPQGVFVKNDNFVTWDEDAHRGPDGIPEGWNVYNKSEIDAIINNYLIIEPLEDNFFVQFTYDCQYSLDGFGWLNLPAGRRTITVNTKRKLYFKANDLIPNDIEGIGQFIISGKCNLLGNCNSMLFGDDANNNNDISAYPYAFKNLFAYNDIIEVSPLLLPATKLAEHCYETMFYSCSSLSKSPILLATERASYCYYKMFSYTNAIPDTTQVDFSTPYGLEGLFAYTNVTDNDLERLLPQNELTGNYCLLATELTDYCYYEMFRGCTNITTAPELPATVLSNNCYRSMFYGCTSLSTPPDLPATTLANYCYYCMFYDCTSLTTVPELPATTLYGYCYAYMFHNTALQETPELPATILANYCYYNMFSSCKSLITAKNLNHVTKLAIHCCNGMFYGCTSLETAPIIPNNISMPTYCYSDMFQECTSLKEVQDVLCESEDISIGQGCFSGMFRECSSLTKAPEIRVKKVDYSSCYYMFAGCTSLETAPDLPATSLNTQCYGGMFYGCTRLTTAPDLPATTLSTECYSYMFYNCTSLTTAPELPATTLANSCYNNMFYNCTSLQYQKQGDTIIEGIKLPAILLVSNCYHSMFYICRKINRIYASFINEPGEGFTTNWLNNTSKTGTFIKSKNTMWVAEDYRGSSGIPENWIVEESDDNGIIYNPSEYLTIEALENELIVSFSNNCQYSTDYITWTDLTAGTMTSTINIGDKIYFKATDLTPVPNEGIGTFTVNKNFRLSGNVMSMLFGDEAKDKIDLTGYDYAFNSMFENCSTLVSVSHDFLPAITLSEGCYESMFENCTSLTIAPELLAENLVEDCYKNMFKDCESLEYIKIMSSTNGSDLYTQNWVNGVTTNNGIFIHADDVIWNGGNNEIPFNWIDKNYSDINKYMTIQSLEDDNQLSYTRTCEYSYDTNIWNSYTASENPLNITLNANDIIYFKSENAYIDDNTGVGTFELSKKFRLYGNCNSMLFGDNANIDTALQNYAFYKMFINSPVTKVSTDFLPASVMSSYCYSSMFEGCSNLKNTPELPAMTLVSYCYYRMFYDCYSLEDVMENLPATTLKNYSYSNMFKQCISLKTSPEINAEIVSTYSCSNMFSNCVSLETAPTNLKATDLKTYCYLSMFESCVSLIKSPVFIVNYMASGSCNSMFKNCKKLIETDITLNYDKESYNSCQSMFNDCISLEETLKFSATTLAGSCYRYMYNGCKSLKIAHDLPGIKLLNSCYFCMFNKCTSLVNAPKIYATDGQSESYSCYQMFSRCSSLENVPDINVDNWGNLSCYIMFQSCTSLKKAPKLTAKNVSSSSYYQMFVGCSSLKVAPDLNITELKPGCFNMMFCNCSSLETSPKLPATILSNNCYVSMFRGCTSLKVAPELPAMTLVAGCYKEMFYGCKNLQYVKALFETTPESNYTGSWLYNTTASDKIFVKSDTAIWDNIITPGSSTVPSTWNIHNESEISFKETDYLIMEALERGFSAQFSNECEYSLDGLHWETLSANTPTISVHTGCKLYFKGNLTPTQENGIGTFTTTEKFNLLGNCNAMIFGDNVEDKVNLTGYDYVFKGLFEGQPVVNIESGFLPSTILSEGCYEGMFKNCDELLNSPELPATTLTVDCYKEMFYGCSSLEAIKALFITPPSESYMENWVYGVADQGIFELSPEIEWNVEDYRGVSGIPENWNIL